MTIKWFGLALPCLDSLTGHEEEERKGERRARDIGGVVIIIRREKVSLTWESNGLGWPDHVWTAWQVIKRKREKKKRERDIGGLVIIDGCHKARKGQFDMTIRFGLALPIGQLDRSQRGREKRTNLKESMTRHRWIGDNW
jgi:hypothetical protein